MPEAERKFSAGRVFYPLVAGLAILQGGCLLAVAGVCAGGAATGYFYCKGRIYRDFPAGLPDLRNATHAALADLHFLVFTEEPKDGKDFIVTKTAAGKKVRIYLDCLPSPIPAEGVLTRVSIRVATFGDESVSARILDQIAWRLAHPGVLAPAPQPPLPGPPVPIQQTSAVKPAFQTSEPPPAPQPVKK
ncbi:MAG TPA: DUF3568 family protein [Gemmataceae bacterium]|jgi:hypothetical protein